jgi:hypothetical protein
MMETVTLFSGFVTMIDSTLPEAYLYHSCTNGLQRLILTLINLMQYLGLIKHRPMNTYGGVEVELCKFLTLARRVVSFTLRPLYPGAVSPAYPFIKISGGFQSRHEGYVGRQGTCRCWESNSGFPVVQ